MKKQETVTQNEKIEFANDLLIQIGLEVDQNQNVIDQESGIALKLNGKTVKYPFGDGELNSKDIPFDPLSNSKLSNKLFNYYVDKLQNEDERTISSYGSSVIEDKKIFEYIENGNRYITNKYANDSLAYAEMIKNMNGEQGNYLNLDKPLI